MISDEDLERAEAYTLIGHLFRAPPTSDALATLAEFEGDDTPLGRAVADLAAAARTQAPSDIDGEFADLFVGITERDALSPYGAVHRTGSLGGQVLLDLRQDLAALGIARRQGETETEDHVSALCEVMAGLITGQLGQGAPPGARDRFFARHVKPWMAGFAANVEAVEGLRFYAAAGRFARLFLEQEAASAR